MNIGLMLLAVTLGDFALPPKSVFSAAMPRYPNAWFYVEESMAPSHEAAVKLVTDRLRTAMRLREYYGPFDNSEGCDFEARIEHLQPWQDRAHPKEQHSHSFHMRYYYKDLARARLERVTIRAGGAPRAFWRFAASVHYEVEHSNPNHADVEICPLCGRTGEYRAMKGSLVELVHDPLGLELLLSGKIRGEPVRHEDYETLPVRSVESAFKADQFVFPGMIGDKNTLRVGVIVLGGSR